MLFQRSKKKALTERETPETLFHDYFTLVVPLQDRVRLILTQFIVLILCASTFLCTFFLFTTVLQVLELLLFTGGLFGIVHI